MIMPRHLPPDACFDDPVDKLDPIKDESEPTKAYAMAAHGLKRIKAWAAQGNVRQRAMRDDLVTLCMCPEYLPCKRPSASWVAQQHGVSREYTSRLCREFARKFGNYIQFRGQRFLNRTNAL